MLKRFIFLATFSFIVFVSSAQDMKAFKLYDTAATAGKDIEILVEKAKKANKHVVIQVGGNWCIWCARFNEFVTKDKTIDSLVGANYFVYHLNYSKENKNTDQLEKYKFPQRFGFPVFLVLDGKGNLLHTQSSWYLESGKSYDKEKVMAFFSDWSKKALEPDQYKEEK